ncbi:hypothetical protein K435DRAFT_902025, partial [Dendrothele bispora CBS 962.96]
ATSTTLPNTSYLESTHQDHIIKRIIKFSYARGTPFSIDNEIMDAIVFQTGEGGENGGEQDISNVGLGRRLEGFSTSSPTCSGRRFSQMLGRILFREEILNELAYLLRPTFFVRCLEGSSSEKKFSTSSPTCPGRRPTFFVRCLEGSSSEKELSNELAYLLRPTFFASNHLHRQVPGRVLFREEILQTARLPTQADVFRQALGRVLFREDILNELTEQLIQATDLLDAQYVSLPFLLDILVRPEHNGVRDLVGCFEVRGVRRCDGSTEELHCVEYGQRKRDTLAHIIWLGGQGSHHSLVLSSEFSLFRQLNPNNSSLSIQALLKFTLGTLMVRLGLLWNFTEGGTVEKLIKGKIAHCHVSYEFSF